MDRSKRRAAKLLDCFEQSRKRSERAVRYARADYDKPIEEEA